jgi:UDP-N-acetylmuramate dehydrogenase
MTDHESFADLTTMRVGGPAGTVLRPARSFLLVEAMLETWASGEDWLVVGGGSNLLVSDEGFGGTVVQVATRGIERLRTEGRDDVVRLRVQAGEPWDELVAYTVEQGWSGIEALSGIPGSTGAAPIQNIGAYGQEVGESLVAVEFLDYLSGELVRLPIAELGLGYRTSVFKQGREGVIVSIELELHDSGDGLSQPVAYQQLATALGVELGGRVPVAEVRSTVLALRASKGMVLDPADPDSASCGSFFTNPIVGENFARTLPSEAPRWPVDDDAADVAVPLGEQPAAPLVAGEHRVKLSAAWLIEHAGITRGFALPGSRAAVSSKHTLALTNRGGATAEEVAELARYVRSRVLAEFGVHLQPEPNLVGIEL